MSEVIGHIGLAVASAAAALAGFAILRQASSAQAGSNDPERFVMAGGIFVFLSIGLLEKYPILVGAALGAIGVWILPGAIAGYVVWRRHGTGWLETEAAQRRRQLAVGIEFILIAAGVGMYAILSLRLSPDGLVWLRVALLLPILTAAGVSVTAHFARVWDELKKRRIARGRSPK